MIIQLFRALAPLAPNPNPIAGVEKHNVQHHKYARVKKKTQYQRKHYFFVLQFHICFVFLLIFGLLSFFITSAKNKIDCILAISNHYETELGDQGSFFVSFISLGNDTSSYK